MVRVQCFSSITFKTNNFFAFNFYLSVFSLLVLRYNIINDWIEQCTPLTSTYQREYIAIFIFITISFNIINTHGLKRSRSVELTFCILIFLTATTF